MKIYPYVKRKPPVIEAPSKKKSDYVAKNNDKSKTPKGLRNAKKSELIAAVIDHLNELEKSGAIKQITKNMLTRTYVRMHNDHKLAAAIQKDARTKRARKLKKQEMLLFEKLEKRRMAASKAKGGTTIPLKTKNASTGSEKTSTTLKQAA